MEYRNRGFARVVWKATGRSWISRLASAGLTLILLAALLAPLLAPYNPEEVDLDRVRLAPCRAHPLGTDSEGRDILSRVIYGARVSLLVGVLATLFALLLGVGMGLLSGGYGGVADRIVTALIDVTLAFPSLLLAIGITVLFRPGLLPLLLAMGITGWASFARLVRGMAIKIRESEYVQASRALGSRPLPVIARHILPNCAPLVVVVASLRIGSFILTEAGLSFLGLGIPEPTPTWGQMISSSRDFIGTAPWMALFPGLALAATIVCLNLMGDSLRSELDPKLRL